MVVDVLDEDATSELVVVATVEDVSEDSEVVVLADSTTWHSLAVPS